MSKEKDMVEARMQEKREELINSTGNANELMEIANRTIELLDKEYNATVSDPGAVMLVSAVFLMATAEHLKEEKSTDENVVLNMFDLFNFGVTYRESDDGEKEGNFTPFMEPRPSMKTMFKSDDETEEND